MRTVILELLNDKLPDECFGEVYHPDNLKWGTADVIHQLLCDCMATAMYRCMEHIPQDKQGLARVRLAEYGFSKAEIEQSITKLENE